MKRNVGPIEPSVRCRRLLPRWNEVKKREAERRSSGRAWRSNQQQPEIDCPQFISFPNPEFADMPTVAADR
jgi:hypothetical protein